MLVHKAVEANFPWFVDHTYHLYELDIKPGATLTCPEGKFLTLTVNGVGRTIQPGSYKGDIYVSVTDSYPMAPHGLMVSTGKTTSYKQAVVIRDNQIQQQYFVPAILQDAEVGERVTDGLYLASTEEDFNGFILEGKSEYTIRNSRFDMEGMGHNDWLGIGAAITAIDDARVTIENCGFHFAGVTRCALQVGGHSDVVVRNCDFINISPDGSDWVDDFSWGIGFRGHNRINQFCDSAHVRYENCRMHGNGWGLLSIDGSFDPVEMIVKDCHLTLTGPLGHGYGAFNIGDNHIVYDHSVVDVYGYPVLLMGMEGKAVFDVINGCEITGRRFGAMVIDDDNSVLNIIDSSFRTGKSSICMKGSSTVVNITRSTLISGNGTILQLMDCDESGMNIQNYPIPVGVADVAIPGRNLAAVSPTEDVTINLTDCSLTGNFFNSTTNIRAYRNAVLGGMGKLCEGIFGYSLVPDPDKPLEIGIQDRHNGDDLKGPKNLGLNLFGSTVTGVISSATQAYRDGLTSITFANGAELSNVTQTAAKPVNNGVVVTLDGNSAWTVTGTSYLTALALAEGAVLTAVDGKALTMTVDGMATDIQPGRYTGLIELTVI